MSTKIRKNVAEQTFEQFVGQVELLAMGLTDISAHLDRATYMKLRKEKESTVHKVSNIFQLGHVGDGFFDATANYDLFVGDRGLKTKAVSIHCAFTLHFHAQPPIEKSKAQKFAQEFLAAITWPYFR